MCETLFWILEPQLLPLHPTSTYTCGVTIAPKVCSGKIPLLNIKVLAIIYCILFQTKSLFVWRKKKKLSHSLSKKRFDMEDITTTTTGKYFFTIYMHLICLLNMHTVNLVVYFIIICKIKTKIHYEFTTIKICRFSQ